MRRNKSLSEFYREWNRKYATVVFMVRPSGQLASVPGYNVESKIMASHACALKGNVYLGSPRPIGVLIGVIGTR